MRAECRALVHPSIEASFTNCHQTHRLQFLRHVTPGMALSVSGPFGGVTFCPPSTIRGGHVREFQFSSLVFICAGTGVTPIYQMLLEQSRFNDPSPPVTTLVYSNRNHDNRMLADEIGDIQSRAPWLHVHNHVTGGGGRISAENLQTWILPNLLEGPTTAAALVCGPPTFNMAIEGMLVKLGFPTDRILLL